MVCFAGIVYFALNFKLYYPRKYFLCAFRWHVKFTSVYLVVRIVGYSNCFDFYFSLTVIIYGGYDHFHITLLVTC
ncbi:hypothetical protein C2134_03025 [Chromobacterium sinusclupearum]|uniref:Uncharacterized protein n=1 Tax=Chromobacterium sinusclupearum TaxID=2077146 RepID=A0A2K4MSV3_9NEIS|nr:hypothetical protein C2134_03025 [Chromobacterium sinusclupearum]